MSDPTTAPFTRSVRFDLENFISTSTGLGLVWDEFNLVLADHDLVVGNGVLAGGAVRRLLLGEVCNSDWDYFFPSEETLQSAETRAKELGWKLLSENELNLSFEDNARRKVQFIRLAWHPDAESVIDSFDFTICQFAVEGTHLVCGPRSLWDLARRRLVIHRLSFAAASLRRAIKYSQQGFTLCGGMAAQFLQQVSETPGVINAEVQYVD